jgi:two-component system, response regulator RegA
MSVPLRILLVDDDVAFCQILCRHLLRRGMQTDVAHDAESALQAAAAFAPDRIVLDLRLGTDNGLHLIRALQDACPDARIVLATGYASIATAVDAMRRGAWNYLPKPFGIDALLHAFEAGAEHSAPASPTEVAPSLRRQGWEHMQRVLADCSGNVSAAARVLGVDRRTLQRRLAKRPVRERS